MSRRSIVSLIRALIALVILGVLLAIGMSQQAKEPTLQEAPLNNDFVKELQQRQQQMPAQYKTPSGHMLGYLPEPIDRSYLTAENAFAPGALKSAQSLPSTYDMRTVNKVTPVKNQGPAGTCWAFASMGSLESNVLPDETADYSENNLKNNSGFSYDPNSGGGNSSMSTAYFARWAGPLSETDDPYNPNTKVSPTGKPVQKHLQQVIFVPGRTNSLDNNTIKQALMTYGAIYTSIYWTDSAYKSSTASYCFTGTNGSNHAVTIVGWNDGYSRSNFATPPAGDGAFIMRNSWGSSWGQGGYFYISYYDSRVGGGNTVFSGSESASNYAHIYQYDTLGNCSNYGYGSNTGWFANIFTASGNESLTAVSMYSATGAAPYTISVYLTPTNGPLGTTPVLTQNGTMDTAGYHTVTLSSPVALTQGQHFSVVVKLTTPGYNYPIPTEYPIGGYSDKATAAAGVSYVSWNGTTWKDATVATSNMNVCVKAFTTAGSSAGAQPDVQIRKHSTATYLGGNIYNVDDDQTLNATTANGHAAVYDVKVQNDGGSTDNIVLSCSSPGSGWSVKCFDALTGSTEVTSAMCGSGWTRSLPSDGTAEFRIEVTPGDGVAANATDALTITATSGTDGAKGDAVIATTTAVPAVSVVTLTPSAASPQLANTAITLTATPTGGNVLEYKYLVGKAATWTSIGTYTTAKSCIWTPTTAGAYQVKVWAREVGSTSDYEVASTPFDYTITASLTGVSLAASPASPRPANVPITLTATTTGGTTVQYQYQKSTNSGGSWTTLKAYSSDTTYQWTPTAPGSYLLQVIAREQGQTATFTKSIPYTITPALSAVTLAVSPASAQPINTLVKLTATATGGASLQYQFETSTDGTTWTPLALYAAANSANWRPTAANTYQLRVRVRDGNSGEPVNSATASYTITAAPPTSVTLTTALVSPQPINTAITLTAKKTGGTNVEYKFDVSKDAGATWSALRAYSSEPTYAWTPTIASAYQVQVTAREQGLTTFVTKKISYTITPVLSVVQLAMSPAAAQPTNATITLTGTPTGGANLQYQFQVSKDGTNWTTVRAYAITRTALWKPTAAGTYTVRVQAREGSSGEPVTSMPITEIITPLPPSAVTLTADLVSPRPINTAVVLTAKKTGGTNVEYKYEASTDNGLTWSSLHDYGSESYITWTPSTAGSYLLRVTAREHNLATGVAGTLKYTVTPVLSAVRLTTSLASAQPLNTPITLTGVATGGANVQFLFQTSRDGTTWTPIGVYSAVKTTTWRPTAAGAYQLRVLAREGSSGEPVTAPTVAYTITPAPPTAVILTASPLSPRPVSTVITLMARKTGGTNVEYEFKVSANYGATWTTLSAFATGATCSWTPTIAGSYLLQVSAREQGLTNATATGKLTFSVTARN